MRTALWPGGVPLPHDNLSGVGTALWPGKDPPPHVTWPQRCPPASVPRSFALCYPSSPIEHGLRLVVFCRDVFCLDSFGLAAVGLGVGSGCLACISGEGLGEDQVRDNVPHEVIIWLDRSGGCIVLTVLLFSKPDILFRIWNFPTLLFRHIWPTCQNIVHMWWPATFPSCP